MFLAGNLLHLAAVGLFVVAILWAMVSDLTWFRIPNAIPVVVAALFLVAGLALPGAVAWLSHLAASALVFMVSLLLFRFGLFGGGDVKLIAAIALWFGMTELPQFLMYMGLFGGALALLLLGLRTVAHAVGTRLSPGEAAVGGAALPRLLRRGEPVPYGVAIGLAALLTAPNLPPSSFQ